MGPGTNWADEALGTFSHYSLINSLASTHYIFFFKKNCSSAHTELLGDMSVFLVLHMGNSKYSLSIPTAYKSNNTRKVCTQCLCTVTIMRF